MFGGLSPYSNTLLMGGLGMLSGQNPQAGFQNAMVGVAQGSEMDQSRRDRKKQAEQLAALHAAMQAGDFGQQSPTMQAYMQSNPDIAAQVATQQLAPKPFAEYAADSYGRIFNKRTGEYANNGGDNQAPYYGGTGDNSQLANHMLSQGYSKKQVDDYIGGKVVTNPADMSLQFKRLQDLIGAPEGQQQQMPAPQMQQPSAMPQQGNAQPPMMPMQGGQGSSMSGMPPQVGTGGIQLTAGKPNRNVTSTQAQAMTLETMASPDAATAEKLYSALGNKTDLAKAYGGKIGEYFQSPDYQVAADAVTNVTQSYLYTASGANSPDKEFDRQLKLVMPTIIDSPQRIVAKKKRLQRMMYAMQIKARTGISTPIDQLDNPSLDEGGASGSANSQTNTTSNGVSWTVAP